MKVSDIDTFKFFYKLGAFMFRTNTETRSALFKGHREKPEPTHLLKQYYLEEKRFDLAILPQKKFMAIDIDDVSIYPKIKKYLPKSNHVVRTERGLHLYYSFPERYKKLKLRQYSILSNKLELKFNNSPITIPSNLRQQRKWVIFGDTLLPPSQKLLDLFIRPEPNIPESEEAFDPNFSIEKILPLIPLGTNIPEIDEWTSSWVRFTNILRASIALDCTRETFLKWAATDPKYSDPQSTQEVGDMWDSQKDEDYFTQERSISYLKYVFKIIINHIPKKSMQDKIQLLLINLRVFKTLPKKLLTHEIFKNKSIAKEILTHISTIDEFEKQEYLPTISKFLQIPVKKVEAVLGKNKKVPSWTARKNPVKIIADQVLRINYNDGKFLAASSSEIFQYKKSLGYWTEIDPLDIKKHVSDAVVQELPNKTDIMTTTIKAFQLVRISASQMHRKLFQELNEPRNVINLKNTLVEIIEEEDGRVYPKFNDHDYSYYQRNIFAFSYDESSIPNNFLDIFKNMLGSPEAVETLCEAIGYSMMGYKRLPAIFYCKGNTGAGKGILRYVIELLFGQFMADQKIRSIEDRFGVEKLESYRVLYDDDAGEHDIFGSGFIKSLVETKKISYSRKFKSKKECYPAVSLWLNSNHSLRSRDTSDAIVSRIQMFYFPKKFKRDAKKLVAIQRMLKNERDTIGTYCLKRGIDVLRRGYFIETKENAIHKENWATSQNPIKLFLLSKTISGETYRILAGDLYNAYYNWSTFEERLDARLVMTKNRFYNQLATMGYKKEYTVRKRLFILGLKLTN